MSWNRSFLPGITASRTIDALPGWKFSSASSQRYSGTDLGLTQDLITSEAVS
jgi:hypothetical protein